VTGSQPLAAAKPDYPKKYFNLTEATTIQAKDENVPVVLHPNELPMTISVNPFLPAP